MKLFFFKLDDYDDMGKAESDGALRWLYLEDAANPSLSTGTAADVVEAVLMAVKMMDGNARVQFVLQSDEGDVLDTLPIDPTETDAFKSASEWCIKHLGCDLFDLGWSDDIVRVIERGEDAIEECRHLADKYDLAYIVR